MLLLSALLLLAGIGEASQNEARQIRAGIEIDTALGAVLLVADTTYYHELGFVKGADPINNPHYSFTRRGEYCVFYPVVANNNIAQLFFPVTTELDRFETSDNAKLRQHWIQAIEAVLPDGTTVIPITYLQGLARGDLWFDVSPGVPTKVTVIRQDDVVEIELIFDAPTYLLIRIPKGFDPTCFDGLFSARSKVTVSATGVDVQTSYTINQAVYHHNGFFFLSVRPVSEPYALEWNSNYTSRGLSRTQRSFRHAQAFYDGTWRVVEHGHAPGKPYDQGPYIEEDVTRELPEFLDLHAGSASKRVYLRNFRDLIYHATYMDMFGVQFPRNAIVANYSQFGEGPIRLAAMTSYTGIGMGWIPVRLLPGAYRCEWFVATTGDLAPPTVATRTPTAQSEAHEATAAKAAAERDVVLYDDQQDQHKQSISDDLLSELKRHWSIRDARDWRLNWLNSQWVDWPKYWSRNDPFELAHLIWETLWVLGSAIDAHPELRERVASAWSEEVWHMHVLQTATGYGRGSVGAACTDLGIVYLLAAANLVQRWMPHLVTGEDVQWKVLGRWLEQRVDATGQPSFEPTPELARRRELSLVAARFVYCHAASFSGVPLPESVVARANHGMAEMMTALRAEDIERWYPDLYWLSYPSLANLLATKRPDLVNVVRETPNHTDPIPPPYAIRSHVSFPEERGWVYLPQTVYGDVDLLVVLGEIPSADDLEHATLSVRARAILQSNELLFDWPRERSGGK